MNFLKIQNKAGEIIAELPLANNAETLKSLTDGLIGLIIKKAEVAKGIYPKDTPKDIVSKVIKGTVAGIFVSFEGALLVESKVDTWEKTAFGGKEIDFNDPEYWYLKGYNPEKDSEGKFRKAVEMLFKQVDALAQKGIDEGIIGKYATLSCYFQSNYKGKEKDKGLAHTFPFDDDYKSKF